MDILNAIFPVFFLLALGSGLKASGMTHEAFLKTADRLVYFIFFPVMLFWKIGSAPAGMHMAVNLCAAGIGAVFLIYLLSLLLIIFLPVPREKAGSFSQACYRFNTYIGMAVVMNTLGEEGVRYFGILIGFAIPVINVLAVSTLIWYSGRKESPGRTILRLFKALIANPLIIACLLGLIFSHYRLTFPVFIDNTFSLMTAVTMPLALISIGGSLTFSGLRQNAFLSSAAALVKTAALPAAGFLCLKLFGVSGAAFKAGLIFFALPTSTAIYVLSSQLNSDLQLASSAILSSTMVSFFSLSAAIYLINF